MYIYLSKILPLFVLPPGILIISLLLALILLWRGWRKSARLVLATTLLLFWLFSTPFFAGALYFKLTEDHPPLALAEIPTSDCIILLGGSVAPALYPRVDIELSEAVDRVYKAAQLYRAGKGSHIIVAAGNQPWSLSTQTEAEITKDLLQEWGVKESAILLDGASRNTRENALNAKTLIKRSGCESALLVTSAAHMPRSVAVFEKVGLAVVPVSTDIRAISGVSYTLFAFLPQMDALSLTTETMHEWLGIWVYRWRNWA